MEKTLLVLAAGMGSRFGGLKQIEPVGPNGEFIIDYSIYDAIRAGFTKVVFVIKEENLEIFENTVGKRIKNHIKVEYAFQKMDDIPCEVPKDRVKPWGTGHAIYSAINYIQEPFAVVNADDFYGADAYRVLNEFLEKSSGAGLVGYGLRDTLSKNGAVKRAIIFAKNNIVTDIIESSCEEDDKGILCTPLNGSKPFYAKDDNKGGMSIYGFQPDFLKLVKEDLNEFFKTANLEKDEYLLPDIIADYINKGNQVTLLSTTARWLGMTYREDLDYIKNEIKKYIEEGVYPNNLWED
jgi:dTDP-glucose pyrophosphorylase